MSTLPIEHLGPYHLVAPIGQGSCGTVYRARNTLLNREVAIKLLNQSGPQLANDQAMLRLFMNEAKLAAMLRHPNIVTIYDAVADDACAYIVMESVYNGRSLQRHCKANGLLPAQDSIGLISKCAYALQHAHDEGIVHRDVKPRNILLDHENEPRISDFGLAVAMRTDATMTHLLGAGSPLYMSPEQILEETLSPQTDVFSLGVVLYELLTGVHPFGGESISRVLGNILEKPHRPLSTLRADVPRPLQQIVDRALSKQRGRRYANARDFAADLELVLDLLRVNRSADQLRRKHDVAKSLPFFAEFDEHEIREVTEQSSVRRFGAGETIVAEGEGSRTFFFVLSGEVTVRRGNTDVATLERGSCVGEMAALTGRPRTASVVARKPTIVLMVPPKVLDDTTPGCRLKLKDGFLTLLTDRLEHTLGLLGRKSRLKS